MLVSSSLKNFVAFSWHRIKYYYHNSKKNNSKVIRQLHFLSFHLNVNKCHTYPERKEHLKAVWSYCRVHERKFNIMLIEDLLNIIFIFYFDEWLAQFEKIAATGQLFLKYTGKRRRRPQDRIVKVSFDNKHKPKQISWGSGSRHIDFNDILYIAWGHWTPVFQARKDQLPAEQCFSVIGKMQILDIQATSKQMAELWVKGLRMLIGQTDDEAEALSKKHLEDEDLPGMGKYSGNDKHKSSKPTTKSIMLLSQDLFIMTATTVFRNLEEERIWDIDESVKERFNAKALYQIAVKEEIPWREWNQFIRNKIVTYLRENNRIKDGVNTQ